MFSKFIFSLFALVLLAKAPLASATVIGTTGSSTTKLGYFGTEGDSIFGESLQSPGGLLTSITFSSITLYAGATARLVIAPITGTTPGSALYSSQYTLVNGSNTFSNLNVSTTSGMEYFAYLTVDGVTSNAVKLASFGAVNSSNYTGGTFIYGDANCDSSVSYNASSKYDLAFSATFATPAVAVTPEPSGLMLLATGLMSTGTMLRRRRNAAV